MAQGGFIKLNREKGRELLEEDPQAFLLLSQIALRARRTDTECSRIPLKANQALLGDYKKAGLTRHQYRSTQERLTRYGLATFEPRKKGTIATLTSIEAYDINAEQNVPSNQPPNPPMEMLENEPTKNQPTTIKEPIDNLLETRETPLTRREECKKTTTTHQQAQADLYECLQNHSDLSLTDKRSLMVYPEKRVLLALEWSVLTTIKTTLIQTLHWHCRRTEPPLPPKKGSSDQTAQQNAAWEYNQFLENHGQSILSKKNNEAIPQHYIHVLLDGISTTITLKNQIDLVKNDLKNSMNEILNKPVPE